MSSVCIHSRLQSTRTSTGSAGAARIVRHHLDHHLRNPIDGVTVCGFVRTQRRGEQSQVAAAVDVHGAAQGVDEDQPAAQCWTFVVGGH